MSSLHFGIQFSRKQQLWSRYCILKIHSTVYSAEIVRIVCKYAIENVEWSPQWVKLLSTFHIQKSKNNCLFVLYDHFSLTVSQFCTFKDILFVVENKVCFKCIWFTMFPCVSVYPLHFLSAKIIKVILQNSHEETSQTWSCVSSSWHWTKLHTAVGSG